MTIPIRRDHSLNVVDYDFRIHSQDNNQEISKRTYMTLYMTHVMYRYATPSRLPKTVEFFRTGKVYLY